MKINKLPGVRGSFTAKTEKKTRMFVYAVSGTQAEKDSFRSARAAEGYEAVEDSEYGLLYFTSINHGREAELGVTAEGKIWASNQAIREAQELRGQVSDATVDAQIIAAMNHGSYAKKLVAEPVTDGDGNLNP